MLRHCGRALDAERDRGASPLFRRASRSGFCGRRHRLHASDGSYNGSPRWPILDSNHCDEMRKVNRVAKTIAKMFRRSVLQTVGEFS